MQIHISWKSLLAAIILIIGLALLVRTATLFLTADEPAVAATSPSPSRSAAPASTPAVAPEQPGSDPAGVAESPLAASATATASPEATALPTSTATATSTASATAIPEPTVPPPSATPFQPPTREPTPVPLPVGVVAQGYGQRIGMVSYAFVVTNPNPNLMAQNIRYQVAAYDEAGIVLLTDTDTIPQVGPGQQMGVAKELTLAANLVVTRVDVLLRPGQFVQAPPLQMLEVSNAAFVDGDPPNLTGLLTNPLGRDLVDLNIVGIAYDDIGIIGGGAAVLPFAPAGGQAPVSIPIATGLQATRIEFYAAIDAAP